jgi:hypothetical protein
MKEQSMSLEGHLAELERRHDALDRDIAREWGRPSVDEVKLAELKRRKLHLKDEIVKLRGVEPVGTLH